jgi:hypothetical protein
MGDRKSAYRVLVGRPESKRPLRRPRHRREYNIKMYLKEIGWNDVDSIELAKDRDNGRGGGAGVNAVMKLRVP